MTDAEIAIRERLVAVETIVAHHTEELAALRTDLQGERAARLLMLQEREPYKKLIWGAIGAIGLFLVLERFKVLEKLIR